MNKRLKIFISGACNAFRRDGYSKTVNNYRQVGEIAKKIQSSRSVALSKFSHGKI